MSSQFFGLNIAYSGLLASNAGLNTTANNISNAQTEGYSRQTVTQSAASALRTYTTYGCTGAGVDVQSIDRIRDVFYDFKYWDNNTKVGEYSVLKDYMSQIQNYFVDDEYTEGFSTIFNKMYADLAELKKTGGDITKKQQFVGSAESLAYYFNTMAENLQKLQLEVNDQIKNKVDMINSYSAEIASLNQQINVIELSGASANELKDKRDLIIDKLSLIVDVEVEELPVIDSSAPDRNTGVTRFSVKIAGGQTIVDTDNYSKLVCEAKRDYEKVNQSDAIGLYDVYFEDGREFNLYGKIIGGELRALIDMRDGNNGENFTGKVSDVTNETIDGSVYTVVDIAVTANYLKDLNACTLSSDGGILRLGNQEFHYDSFRAVYDANGEITNYQFIISNDTNKNDVQPDVGRIGREASVGTSVNYQGIPYYQEQLNEWTRVFAAAFNKIVSADGVVDGYEKQADIFFSANKATDDTQWRFYKSTDGSTVISSKDDSYYQLTAKNFAVSKVISEDANLMGTHTKEGSGQDKYNTIEELIDLGTNKEKASFRGATASEFLQCVLSDVALNSSNANTFYNTYTTIQHSIDNQRSSISGVDSDEEAINLVKFQHSYNLASQMIQVLTEVYDRLILQTGV